jgi:hypothetical protein
MSSYGTTLTEVAEVGGFAPKGDLLAKSAVYGWYETNVEFDDGSVGSGRNPDCSLDC